MAKQNVDKSFLNGMTEISPGVWQKNKTTLQPREVVAKLKGKVAHKELLQEIVPQISPEGSLIFAWQGRHVSLNAWYSSKHWTHSHTITNEWHGFFKKFLTEPYPKIGKYKLELVYNSRLDVSNTIAMPKLLEDTLQQLGIIENDSKTFCRGISLTPDETMKKFSYKITVINIATQ